VSFLVSLHFILHIPHFLSVFSDGLFCFFNYIKLISDFLVGSFKFFYSFFYFILFLIQLIEMFFFSLLQY